MITQLIKNGEVVDTSAESNSSSSTSKKSGGSLDKDAFLQLLVAQMKYQDPLEPTDNTEYISQLATFSQLEETQNMQASLQEMEANSLVGKQVVLRVTSSATCLLYTSAQRKLIRVNGIRSFWKINLQKNWKIWI